MQKLQPELFALIKSWGLKPQFTMIVVSIAKHWQRPERRQTNLAQLIANQPTYFR
jgi:hypothetical protein